MKIIAVETTGPASRSTWAASPSWAASSWQTMNTVWLRIVTDQGLEGWGEAFGHACVAATKTVLRHPAGARHPRPGRARHRRPARSDWRKTSICFGRNGPHVFALSALDIALWDIAGKAAGQPLWRLLGGTPRDPPDRLRQPAALRRGRTWSPPPASAPSTRGYRDIKLHEITSRRSPPRARRSVRDARLMVDVNCPWTVWQAIDMARALRPFDLTWLEEPVWPPGDHDGLARVRAGGRIRIAAGENAAGLHDFRALSRPARRTSRSPASSRSAAHRRCSRSPRWPRRIGVRLVPHNAYFGAGYLASLHLNAALAPDVPFERLFIDLEANPYHELVLAEDGKAMVPTGPGLGRDPDLEVLRRYQLAEPTVHRL